MSLTKRLSVALVVALGIVAVTGAVALRTRERLVATSRMVTRTHELIEGLDALLADMVNAETGQRGYVITGDDSYLEPFNEATEHITQDVEDLAQLAEDPRQREILELVKPHVDRKLALAREIIAARRTGGFVPASQLVATNRGKTTMDDIRRLVGEMRRNENERLRQRNAAIESEARFADRMFIAGSLISGLMIAAVFFVLRREVVARQRSEVELRRHNAISDGILSSMVDGVIVADPQGDVLLMNPSAERMLGRSFDRSGAGLEDAQAPLFYLPDTSTPFPPDELPLTRAIRGQMVDGAECVVRVPGRPDPAWFSVSARPLRAADGGRIGGVGVFRDVTEMKSAELALRERNDSLRGSVLALERRNEEVSLLGELSGLLQACLGEDEASTIIAQSLGRLFPNSSGAIYLLNPSRNLVFAGARWGEPPPQESTFAPDDCWSLRRGRVHALEPRRLALRCAHVEAGIESCVCLPLMAQGDALGVLHARAGGASDAASTGELEPRLLDAVADEIGLALANLRLRDSLRQQSIRDPLTNLFNRRYMEESFERELQRAERKGTSIGVLMIDVDHFKHFNDSFGHDAGDALLCELGAALKSSVRGEDIACRYGGEEFVVILPDADTEDSLQRAEALRSKAKGIVVHHAERSLRTVTLSIGVACYPEHSGDARTLIQLADRALYRAKSAGRDRVVLATAHAADAEHAA
jgi:diguanylate cyclase (GGDEF)-like protein